MRELSMEQRMASMQALFNPESIAIIGASVNPLKPSGQPLASLLANGYKGKVYPVNPRYNELYNIPCYPSIFDVPGDIDLAIVAIPAAMTISALKDCVRRGVKSAVVFTSGFAEVGAEGKILQQEMTVLSKESRMLICGPNCMGIFSAHNALMANFAVTKLPERTVTDSFLGFISQSGGFGVACYSAISDRGIGFSHFVSTGNEADLEFSEYLAYMAGDPNTRVIGGYLEGVKDGARLVRAADMAMEAGKPVLLMKSGRHEVAARAAASHTGALVGSDRVYDAVFKQKGIIRMESVEELNAVLSILVSGKIPRGRKVCILATSGGSGVMLADKCAEFELEVPELSGDTRKKLDELLPDFASSANPVDITSQIMTQPGLFRQCAEIILADPNIDILMLCYWAVLVGEDKSIEQIAELCGSTDKMVITLVYGQEEPARDALEKLNHKLIPASRDGEYAIRALKLLAWYNEKITGYGSNFSYPVLPAGAREEVSAYLEDFGPGAKLTEFQSKKILRAYGIPCTRELLAAGPEEAVEAAATIGYPVAMKIESPDILHKTDAGGVILNIDSPERVREAFARITTAAGEYKKEADIKGVLVQEMLPQGTELIAGIAPDSVFGSVVLFGLGGIFVEVLKDVAMRVPSLTEIDTLEMMDEIKGKKVLEGVRGKPPVDKKTLSQVLLRLSMLASDFPQIAEMDINPLLAYPGGVAAADAVIVLK